MPPPGSCDEIGMRFYEMTDDYGQLFYPKRKHPRLKYYDYTNANYYFVTICTYQRQKIFGQPNRLNGLGNIAANGFAELFKHFSLISVDKFVVMPNHVHIILVLQDGSSSLTNIIGQYKSYVTREIHKKYSNIQVWQTSFHEHIIRNQKSYENIWNYIDGNPLKWKEDCFYTD